MTFRRMAFRIIALSSVSLINKQNDHRNDTITLRRMKISKMTFVRMTLITMTLIRMKISKMTFK
jgi:hypothetical protein